MNKRRSRTLAAMNWLFNGVIKLAMVALTFLTLVLVFLWVEHGLAVSLPVPTGSYGVGRTSRHWVEASDRQPPYGGSRRELIAWIWYPANIKPTASPVDDYVPAAWRTAFANARSGLFTHFLDHDLSRVKSHSRHEAPMSPAQRTYPVVVLRAGLAAQSLEYSALAEDLASHGYIVVGIDAPYRTGVVVFPDGRVVTKLLANDPENVSEEEGERIASRLVSEWRADIGFALDQLEQSNEADPLKVFTERLDLTRVGVLGHSLGGATAAQFCLDDPRCKVGIDIDGSLLGTVLKSAPAKPFMFLMGDHSKELDPADRQIDANINAVYNRLPAQSRVLLYIRGANHFNFSDGAVVKSHLVMSVLRIFGVVGLDGQRQLVVTSHCVHTFLDRNLRGDTSVAVLTVSPLYPELQAHL